LLGDGAASKRKPVAISAITGEGIDTLLATIERHVAGELTSFSVRLSPSQLGLTDWLYRNSEVVARKDAEDGSIVLTLRTTQRARAEIESRLQEN
jgi:GTP-binding protein HflX